MNDQDSEFEKRIKVKQAREEAEEKTNGEDPNATYKLVCGCDTYAGEQNAFTRMNIPFPFIKMDGGGSPMLILQFCKKCKSPNKTWWEIPKPNPSKLFKPPRL